MKLKINKACDLNSISVLPPNSRRTSGVGAQSQPAMQHQHQHQHLRSQPSQQQLRSQPSQQSFSQGVSSQLGTFSQLSQNSLDESLANSEQRIGSQEREPSVKRTLCLPPVNYSREDSQLQLSRSSNLMRKWSVPEYKCQISEELEHRIGLIETSLSRRGMILESIQSDVMQVNKGTKEVVLEMESIRQKIIFHDDSLQLVSKGQEEIKSIIGEGFKSMRDQVKQDLHCEHMQEISSMLSAMPQKFESCVQKMQNDLCKTLKKEIQAMASSLKIASEKPLRSVSQLPRGTTYCSASLGTRSLKNEPVHAKVQQAPLVLENETGGWKSVKREQASLKDGTFSKRYNQKRVPPMQPEREYKVIIESDDDTDGGFSCLLNEKEKASHFGSNIGNYSAEDAKEETERLLRKARRRKRKHSNLIIIN